MSLNDKAATKLSAAPPEKPADEKAPSLFKAAVLFILIFSVLELTYNSFRDTVVSEWIIDRITVSTSALILDALNSTEHVEARGNRILSPSVKLTVKVGCEGTETLLLLVAAIAVLSISWRHKIIGMLVGSLLVYVLNLIRIISLFYALKYNKTLFDALHSYVAPLLIVIIVGVCFSLWLSFINRTPDAAEPA